MDKYLEAVVKFIGPDKLILYLEELPRFYFKPISFFENFFRKTFSEKLKQITFYLILDGLLAYFLGSGLSAKEIIKALLIETGMLSITMLFLSISYFLYSKIRKTQFSFGNIFSFLMISKFLIVPFQVIFFGLFLFTENYDFFLAQNLVVLGGFIYIFIFSARIFYRKILDISIMIVINILVLNIGIYIIHKVSIDSFSNWNPEYYEDQILKERFERGKVIKNPFRIPYLQVAIADTGRSKLMFLFGTPFDTAFKKNFMENARYPKLLKENITTLDTIIKNCKFKRNIKFFKKIQGMYVSIDNILNTKSFKIDTTQVIEKSYFLGADSKYHQEIVWAMPESILKTNSNLLNEEIKMEERSNSAQIPLKITDYFTPVQFILPKDSTFEEEQE